MSYLVPSTSLQSNERCESQRHSPDIVSIDILDDDSLLHIFYLYRPFLLGEDEDVESRLKGGNKGWDRGHWWFKLSHVCQRWRNLILTSSSYLDLCLVCTKSTPVADMLAHSPPLPLVVDHYGGSNMNTEDEERLVLAPKQRDRVRRIRLEICMPNSQRLIVAISEEYPILEYLIIYTLDQPCLTLPETLQAPHLHHLVLSGLALPIGSRLLTTAVCLVTLVLIITTPPTYFQPNVPLQWISFMPQLETLVILFPYPAHCTIERQLTPMPIITPITLPNLRWFWFQGINAYVEEIVCKMSTPRLESLQVFFEEQLVFSVPHLLKFMNTIETRKLRFSNAMLLFSSDQVDLATYPHEGDLSQSLHMRVLCRRFDWQVSAMAQISNSLSPMFSAVEHLILSYNAHGHWQSSEEHIEVDRRTAWRRILRSFSNAKTLRIEGPLDGVIARCLRLEDGELPFDILPELHELTYSRNSNTDNEIAPFINARQNADRPIVLVDL